MLEKKISTVGQKLLNEVKGTFETFLQNNDQATLLTSMEKFVRSRFANLEAKVQEVVKKVE